MHGVREGDHCRERGDTNTAVLEMRRVKERYLARMKSRGTPAWTARASARARARISRFRTEAGSTTSID